MIEETIEPKTVSEIRIFKNPPQAVVNLFNALEVMFGVKMNSMNPYNTKSEKIQTSLFLKKLTCFDVRTISAKRIKILEENYIQKKILNVEQLQKVGKPCAQLCSWILA